MEDHLSDKTIRSIEANVEQGLLKWASTLLREESILPNSEIDEALGLWKHLSEDAHTVGTLALSDLDGSREGYGLPGLRKIADYLKSFVASQCIQEASRWTRETGHLLGRLLQLQQGLTKILNYMGAGNVHTIEQILESQTGYFGKELIQLTVGVTAQYLLISLWVSKLKKRIEKEKKQFLKYQRKKRASAH